MIRARTARTSPRQAILAIFQTDQRWPAVSRALAQDIVAAMNAANGFTLGFACLDAEEATEMAPLLPVGVELRLPSTVPDGHIVAAVVAEYAERGFERIITIAADTVGVSTRLLSTAASVLATEPVALGLTPADRVFAVAARGNLPLARDQPIESAIAALTSGIKLRGRARRLEPLTRLREVDELERLKELTGGLTRIVPRTIAAIDDPI